MNLTKALIGGMILSVGAVLLFLLLYFVIFGGAENLPRLLLSLVLPPVILGAGLAGFYLFQKRS